MIKIFFDGSPYIYILNLNRGVGELRDKVSELGESLNSEHPK